MGTLQLHLARVCVVAVSLSSVAWRFDPEAVELRIEQVTKLLTLPAADKQAMLRREGTHKKRPSWVKENYWTETLANGQMYAFGVGTAKSDQGLEYNFEYALAQATSQITRHLGKMMKQRTETAAGPQTTFKARAIVPSDVVDWYLPDPKGDTIFVVVAHARRPALSEQELDVGIADELSKADCKDIKPPYRGKLKLLFVVEATGATREVRAIAPNTSGENVAACVQRAMVDWLFPAFAGESRRVVKEIEY